MSQIARVFLDMDGVLADFWGGALRLHKAPDPYDDPANRGKWLSGFPDIPPAAFWGACGEEFWAGLDPTPEAGAVVELALRSAGKDNVCLLSSPCLTPGCLEGKRRWVARHFPVFNRRLLLGACKEFCAGPGKLLVDDSDENVSKWRSAGGVAALLPRPWNARHGESPPGIPALVDLFRECLP